MYHFESKQFTVQVKWKEIEYGYINMISFYKTDDPVNLKLIYYQLLTQINLDGTDTVQWSLECSIKLKKFINVKYFCAHMLH